MSSSPKIISATIGPVPTSLMGPLPSVRVKLDNGSERKLFHFYPNELHFTEAEFIGLTEAEAHVLYHQKDVAYLHRS